MKVVIIALFSMEDFLNDGSTAIFRHNILLLIVFFTASKGIPVRYSRANDCIMCLILNSISRG